MKESIRTFKKTLKVIGVITEYFGALFGGLYVILVLAYYNELWLHFTFIATVIIVITVSFFVDKNFEREESDRKILKAVSHISSFFYYTAMVFSIMSITRYYIDFSHNKDLIAFIDIFAFVLVAYGSVMLNLIYKERITSFKFRTVLYFSVILYLSFGMFNIYPQIVGDINYFWMIILIDNFMFMVFKKQFNEINNSSIK